MNPDQKPFSEKISNFVMKFLIALFWFVLGTIGAGMFGRLCFELLRYGWKTFC